MGHETIISLPYAVFSHELVEIDGVVDPREEHTRNSDSAGTHTKHRYVGVIDTISVLGWFSCQDCLSLARVQPFFRPRHLHQQAGYSLSPPPQQQQLPHQRSD